VTFWRTVVRFQAEKIAPLMAARNALGVALPLAAAIALGSVPAALIATVGALNVSFSDGYDPYMQRGRRMLAASVLVGVAVFAGALCGHRYAVAVLAAGAWAFAAGLLVAVSTAAADLGVVSLVTLVVFTARPLPLKQAALSGALALAGGLFETVLALAFWPVGRYAPERRALASLYGELSRAAASPLQIFEAPPASAQSTQAQVALATLRDFSIDGERYLMLLSQAERARLALFSLARLRIRVEREGPASPERALLDRYLTITSRTFKSVGDTLLGGQAAAPPSAELDELQVLTDELRTQAGSNRSSSAAMPATLKDASFQMDALTGQLRSATELAASAAPAGLAAFARSESHKRWQLRLHGTLAMLRANLSLQSAACRHAIRLSVCVALGDAFARSYELQRSYWLPMTIAIVLKPDFAATFSRGVLRLAGTFAGLTFATALFHVLPATDVAQVAAIAAMVFVMRCWGPANYGILATAVTALIVLLVAMSGVSPKDVIVPRGLNTTLGGAVALAAYWLWPTWERSQAPEIMARMLDAYRDYFRAIRDSYFTPEDDHELGLDRARLAARLARSNLEASLERLLAEPGASAEIARVFGGMLASSHRLVHAIMALEAGLSSSRPAPAREAFRRFADDVELTLYYLAQALRRSPLPRAALPDLREDHRQLAHSGDSLTERYALVNVETDRITNSLNTLAEQLVQWLAHG